MENDDQENEKKKLHGLDRYIIFSFSCVIIYTIANMILTVCTGEGMDTLTTCFYACFGGEILACAVIKRYKLKEENGGDIDE